MNLDEVMRAIASKKGVEDYKGLPGMRIGHRNSAHTVHNSSVNLLEKGGLVERRRFEYVVVEERVFLTPEGEARVEGGGEQ